MKDLKSNYVKFDKKYLFSIVLILFSFGSVTSYKILYVGNRSFIQMGDEITLSWSLLIPVFVLTIILSLFSPVLILRERLNISVHRLVPDIRKKKLRSSAIFILLIIIWSIYIISLNNLLSILLLILMILWFLSLMTAALFGFRFIYRSDKYNLLKFLFYFYPSVTGLFYKLLQYAGNSTWVVYVFTVFYCLIILYQIINFYNNYRNYKEDYERKYNSGWTRFLGGDFFGHLEGSAKKRSLRKLIQSFKLNKSIRKRACLFQFSMFPNTTDRIKILASAIEWFIYFIILYVVGIKYGSIFIFYMYIYQAFGASTIFRNKSKIQHLYVTSGQKRNDFEFTILFSVAEYFIKASLIDLVFILTGYFIFARFYNSIDLMYIFLIFGISFLAKSLIIFSCWKVYLQNKDYDVIDKRRMLSI